MSIDDNNSYLTSIAIGFAVALPCIGVGLRLLARTHYRIPLGWDDWTMVIGALFTIGNSIDFIFTNRFGNGRHIETLTPEDIRGYFLTFYVGDQLFGFAITFIKISVLLFYRRVFPTQQLRMWINIIGAFVIAWFFANNLASAFQCTPIHKAWDIEQPGHCYNPYTFTKTIQGLNVVLDFVILALPISAVMRLQMSRSRKLSVILIFLLGGLAIVIGIARIPILVYSDTKDPTFATAKCSWNVMEPAVEVFSACLPTMAPLLQMRIRLRSFTSALRYLVPSRKSSRVSSRDDVESVHQQPPFLRPDRQHAGAVITEAAAKPSVGRGDSDSDEIPLRSIKVHQDVYWEETQA